MSERVIHTVKTDMVIHTERTGMMRLVVEIECVGKIADVFDKVTGSFDGLQPEQVDLNYIHALKEPHLHEIRDVLKPVTTSQPNPQTSTKFQNQQFQEYHTATLLSNNAKFPYLKKDEYETWAMKMKYWINYTDHNLWKIIQNGNSKKSLGRDSKGGIIILHPVSFEEHVDEKARYSAFKILETKEVEQVYGLMARFESDFLVPAGNAVCGVNPAAIEFAMIGNSPEAKLEKKEWEVKFVESLARFNKWKESSKNLAKLLYSSMSTRTKLGLGFKEYIRSDEVCDLSTPSVCYPKPDHREVKSLYERFVKAGKMHEVPSPITRTFMPTSYQSDLAETKEIFGSKSNTYSIPTSESNDFVSCDNSDKSSASETYDFASCVSSPMTNDSFSTVDVKLLPKSDAKDPSPTNGFSSCRFKKNVKSTRNLCNKSRIADRIHCKNNFVRFKKYFVCGNKSHLIKDCHVYDTVDNFLAVVSKVAYVPAASRNRSASIHAGRSIPAASRNRSVSIHAGRSIPATCKNLVYPHVNKDIGIIDSGCSRNMTGNKEKLDDFV
nr:serine-threonine/tyrosine-protein kinase catalytic domain-containing protein [Tanacetum cinerariifolium]